MAHKDRIMCHPTHSAFSRACEIGYIALFHILQCHTRNLTFFFYFKNRYINITIVKLIYGQNPFEYRKLDGKKNCPIEL